MQIRIEGTDLPGTSCGPSPQVPDGHRNIHVGVQRKNQPGVFLELTRADVSSVSWTLDCSVGMSPTGTDLKGPYVSGPPGGRFIYLSWGMVGDDEVFTMFRRAKLMFDAVPPDVMEKAVARGLLVGRLGLTDAKGNPMCAAVRPPTIVWSA